MSAADKSGGAGSVTARFRPRTRVRKAARLLLTERFDSLWARHGAALAGDAEAGIHQMRVEAKRLREAMRLFADVYRAADFQAGLAEDERLNDLLGAVRDADVLVEFLGSLFKGDVPLLQDLRATIVAQRAVDQAALVAALEQLVASDFAARFRAMCRAGRHGVRHALSGTRLAEFAPLAVGERLRRVRKRLRAVQGEEDAAGLHRVRVANKLLRYAMEAFVGIYDRRFEEAYKRVVELHKALGDLHDLDVLAARIVDHAQSPADAPELAPVLERIAARRAREYGRIQTFCDPDGMTVFAHQVMDALE